MATQQTPSRPRSTDKSKVLPESPAPLSLRKPIVTASMPTRPNPRAAAPPTRQTRSSRSGIRTPQVPSSARRPRWSRATVAWEAFDARPSDRRECTFASGSQGGSP